MSADTQTALRPKRYTPGPLPLDKARAQIDRMESLLANLQRNGQPDATVRELCEAYKATYGEEMFPHHGEARCCALEAAGRVLCDRDNKRLCRVTAQRVKVYRLIPKQVDFL